MSSELKRRTEQTEKLYQIIPACANQSAAGRWANQACLCVPARRQEEMGYGA